MVKSYFKIALRNLSKHKTLSAINILGLTTGLASCFFIALYIRHEITYDRFQLKGNRIARVIMEYNFDGGSESNKGNFTSVRVAPVFKSTFPEVENAVRMANNEKVVEYKDKLFNEKKFMFADPAFFRLFSFKLLRGDIKTALTGPYQVMVTKSVAKKYFGDQDPVGKVIRVGSDSAVYQVTGVLGDCPSNSQIKFDFLASFSSLGLTNEDEKTYWDANYTTYLLLKDRKSIASLQAKLPAFMKKEMAGQGATVNFYLEPFSRIHLYSAYGGFEPNNSIAYIYILAAVALLILIIVCSTYINLCTAQSIERAKEVGVRKVIGAGKKQLFWQFIGESALLCLVAVLLSVMVVISGMPWFNRLVQRQLEVNDLFSLPFIFFCLAIVICISLLAGSYPAVMLTRFQPVQVLKGSFKNTSSGQWLRKSLIIFQFTISVFLIVATAITQRQLYYIQHKKLGYSREHVLVLPMDKKMLASLPVIKQIFTANPGVLSVSRCVRSPVEGGGGYNMRSALMPEDVQVAVMANPVDEDYVKTTGLQIISGSDFTEQDTRDVSPEDQSKKLYHFILNESAAKQLGWTATDAVGKKMFLDNSRPGIVKGVVKNFHFESLHNAIKPFVLFTELRGKELLVKLAGSNLTQTISFLASAWKDVVPGRPFEYRFMDEDYNTLYSSELRLGEIMTLFASIAIVLACLGLFGISSYTTQQRFKEIGIRKVLGASVAGIVRMLSSEFLKLVLISSLVAIPLAWFAMNRWLQDFTYRVEVGWKELALSAVLTFFVALITVSVRAIKAAIDNPVNSLRTE